MNLRAHNSSLEGTSLCHSAPLEVFFPTAFFFFFAGIKFWPKTIDYNIAFRSISLRAHNSSLEGLVLGS